ncbi:MAG: SIMPL domain-containing protein [Chloroflexi bacterium]|nr:SIMPL domain-containing protein [Chloroflexota bacterium]
MKQTPAYINSILLAVIAFLLLSTSLPVSSVQAAPPSPTSEPVTTTQTSCDSTRTVQVTGTALINVTPDRALIQLGVQSNGATVDMVEFANSAAINKVIKALKAQGVDPKDISTDFYMIEPVYENYDSLYIKGYRINNTVSVTVRDVKKANAILGAALKAGANQVANVEFYTSDLRKYRDQARELAMTAAKEKAQALADAAGAKADCVLNINENSWSYYNGWWWWWGNQSQQNVWTQNTVQNAAPSGGGNSSAGSGDEPLSLGTISVKAEVSATFGLK